LTWGKLRLGIINTDIIVEGQMVYSLFRNLGVGLWTPLSICSVMRTVIAGGADADRFVFFSKKQASGICEAYGVNDDTVRNSHSDTIVRYCLDYHKNRKNSQNIILTPTMPAPKETHRQPSS
jgi:hypothetical protein